MAEDGKYVDGSLWFYAPNKPAPIVFALLFTLSFSIHFFQCMHYKSWKFTGLFPWASVVFVGGYACRAAAAWDYDSVDLLVSANVLVYAAPPVYELANYITLGRILYYVPYHSPLHPGRVITTFGGISAIVEILTANGAVKVSARDNPQSEQDVGHALLKAALILQLFVLVAFVSLAAYFQLQCKRDGIYPKNLRNVLYTLYASSVLISVRTIFRTVEYFSISEFDFSDTEDPSELSPIIRYEWYFWVFEGVTMMINTFLINVRHPAVFLPRRNNVYLAKDGVTEIVGPGYMDKRNFLLTCLDPFDIIGLVKGKDKQTRFWDQDQQGAVTARLEGKEVDGVVTEQARRSQQGMVQKA